MQYTPALSGLHNPIYKPLNSALREIRVLELEPGTHDAVVSGRLRAISLATNKAMPEYQAVSYCWGDATAREHVILHGFHINAPASAAEALRYLRYEHQHRILWIDALCINQNDTEERSQQVMLMGNIYRNARLTNVWLGKDDIGLASALKSVRQILDCVPSRVKNIEDSSPGLFGTIMDEITALKIPSHIDFQSLEAIYHRPWFTRQWVFQGIQLSTNAICHIGHTCISWSDLELVSVVLACNRDDMRWASLSRAQRALQWVDSHRLAGLTFAGRHIFTDYRGLVWLYEQTQHMHAIDPRDKIHSLLALTSWANEGEEFPEGIRPNYAASIKRCYTEAARVIIEEQYELDEFVTLLGLTLESETNDDWPSWVPRFDLTENENINPFLGVESFSASGDYAAITTKRSEDDGPYSIRLGCYLLRVVRTTHEPFQLDRLDRGDLREDLRELFLEMNTDEYTLIESWKTTFISLMCASYRQEHLKRDSEIFIILFTVFMHWLGVDLNEYDAGFVKCNSEEIQEHSKDTVNEISDFCKGRCLFLVGDSEELEPGIGPAAVRKGDFVAILLGSALPVIVRKIGSYLRIIGACYLDSIMHGEGVEKWEAEHGWDPLIAEIR